MNGKDRMKFWLAGIAAALLAIAPCAASPESDMNKAKKAYDRGDYRQGVYWSKKAAKRGYAPAQNWLGTCYYNGEGVAQNYRRAVYWYRKAADQGYAKAQFSLGICYSLGEGVAQDYGQAAYWFRKAADQGLAEAQSLLGDFYSLGEGVVQDILDMLGM